MEEVLLKGQFQMLPQCSTLYDVTLTKKNLMFIEQDTGKHQRKLTSILMENAIGCKMYNSKLNRDVCSYFKVIILSKDKKKTRQKLSYAFRVEIYENRESNNAVAENWACMILWIIQNPHLSVEVLQAKTTFPPQKKYFIVINPKSGPGKSLQQFHNVIEPLLMDASIHYDIFITDHAGHLTEKILTFDHSCWDAIVICSGDGLVYEFLNGVMKRPDWKDVLALPIGILPTGSGNALSASVLYSADETFCLVNAVYVLLKGTSHPLDIFSISTRNETMYGFLSITWGIIADIDIESEKYRSIGPLRFQVGAVQRILKLRHYNGIFSYLPGKKNRFIDSGAEISEDEFTSSSLLEDIEIKGSEVGSDSFDIPTLNPTNGSTLLNRTFDSGIDEIPGCSNETQQNYAAYGPKYTLPLIDEPLSPNWITLEGEFVSIVLSAMSHIGSDTHFAPGKCLGSGLLNLQYIKEGPKTRKMFQLMTAVDSGKHVDDPEVVVIEDISAFRLIPEPNELGHICIDGELINYEPIQGEVFPGLAHCLMLPYRTL